MIWKLQTTFSNLSSMKVFEFQLQFHWSLFPRVQLITSQHWFRWWLDTEQARNHYPNQCWPNSPTHVYTALGGNKITKSGRSFHWGLVHPVQSASLCWNSPKIFLTVFETLPVGAKSLPILPPDYWHPPQSNFTEYKQDVVAVFLCTCQWSILLSTLTSVASDLFNYALRLDNELSARPPRGRHGLWTGLKTQMGCLQIVWWNQ